MANLSADSGGGEEGGGRGGSHDNSLRSLAKRAINISLPGLGDSNTRSLFIFSEDNLIRKFAKTIIEWGYPFFFKAVNFGGDKTLITHPLNRKNSYTMCKGMEVFEVYV